MGSTNCFSNGISSGNIVKLKVWKEFEQSLAEKENCSTIVYSVFYWSDKMQLTVGAIPLGFYISLKT